MTDQPGAPGPDDATPPPPPPPPPSGATPPPPPPPPMGAPTPPPPPPGPNPNVPSALANVDVGAAVSWAFAKFAQYWKTLVLLVVVVWVLRLIQGLLSNFFLNLFGGSCGAIETSNGAIVNTANCTTGAVASIMASVVSAIIFGVLAWIATIGIYRAALRTTRGEAPSFADLTTGENLGKYIIVAIVFGILAAVGLVLCIIPGLIVIFFLQFAPWYALDKGYGVGEAFKASIDAVKKAPLPVLIAMIVTAVASWVGGFLFGILTLVALPFAALFVAHIYRQLNKEPVAP